MLNTFMSKANYLAASEKLKVLLINREKSDQPEHLCDCFFFKAFLFAKKSIDFTNLQLYTTPAEKWF